MRILLAADHAGFELKEAVKKTLLGKGYDVVDKGAFAPNPEDDYPDFVQAAAREISHSPEDRAVIFGGSGQGEAMAANRFPHVRAAVFYGGSNKIIKLSREHNNANVLSLGARFVQGDEAMEAILLWLDTHFSGDARHVRRINKLA